MTLSELKTKNNTWFSKENKRFFGDRRYYVYTYRQKSYLIRLSSGWSDMFGESKKFNYYINPLDGYKIDYIVSEQGRALSFDSLQAAKEYIKSL